MESYRDIENINKLINETFNLIKHCEIAYYMCAKWSIDIWNKLSSLLKHYPNTLYQAMDIGYMLSEKILLIATLRVFRSFKYRRNIAREKNIEFLIRLTGLRNISTAIHRFGARDNNSANIFLVMCENNNSEIKKAISERSELETKTPKADEIISGLENYIKALEIDIEPCIYYRDKEDKRLYISCMEKNIINATSYIA